MTQNHTIRTGLLSYGLSGRIFHAPFLHRHPGFSLDAAVERSSKNAGRDYPAIRSYNSIGELLHDKSIELVVVNTPNYLHYEHAKAALEAGKNVLVEKPFTVESPQARELFDLAEHKGLKVFVYQNRRWDSDFQSLRNVIESGRLGSLCEVHIRFDRYRCDIGPKAFKEAPMPGSGLLYDLGPHVLDQVIALFGIPLSWDKVVGANRPGTEVDDYFFVRMSYPEGLNVTVTSSLLVADPQAAFIAHGVCGSYVKARADVQEAQLLSGMRPEQAEYGIEPEGMEGVLTVITDGKPDRQSVVSGRGDYTGIFEAVYRSLRYGESFPVSGEEILCQLEIIEG